MGTSQPVAFRKNIGIEQQKSIPNLALHWKASSSIVLITYYGLVKLYIANIDGLSK